MFSKLVFILILSLSFGVCAEKICKDTVASIRLFNPENPKKLHRHLEMASTYYEAKQRQAKLDTNSVGKKSIWQRSPILRFFSWVSRVWSSGDRLQAKVEENWGRLPKNFANGKLVDLKMSNLTDQLLMYIVENKIKNRAESASNISLKLDYNSKLTEAGIVAAIRKSVNSEGQGIIAEFSSVHNGIPSKNILKALVDTQANSLKRLSIENVRNHELKYLKLLPKLTHLALANTWIRKSYGFFTLEAHLRPLPFVTTEKIAQTMQDIFAKEGGEKFRMLAVPSLLTRDVKILSDVFKAEKARRVKLYQAAASDSKTSKSRLNELAVSTNLKLEFVNFRLPIDTQINPDTITDGDTAKNNFPKLQASLGLEQSTRYFGVDTAEISDKNNPVVYALAIAARNMNFYHLYKAHKTKGTQVFLLNNMDTMSQPTDRNGRFVGIIEIIEANGNRSYLPQLLRMEGVGVSRYEFDSRRDGYEVRNFSDIEKAPMPDWYEIYKRNYKTILYWLEKSPYSVMNRKERQEYFPDGPKVEVNIAELPKPSEL